MTPKIHTHDEAIDALCGCAATVTVLSYQEAIEGYFKLRGLPIPSAAPAPDTAGGGDVLTLRTLLDNLVIAQSLSKAIRDTAAIEARSYLRNTRAALTASPQPEQAGVIGADAVPTILSTYTAQINSTPDLLSILYDADMLPEQTETVRGAISIGAVCEAYNTGLAAHPQEAAVPQGGEDAEFEVIQDDMPVASSSGPRSRAYAEIQHYAAVYGQDGPVEVFEITRTLVPELSTASTQVQSGGE